MEIKLVVGDWSDDGHGKTEEFVIESNLTVKQVEKAYAKGAKKLGVDLKREVAVDFDTPVISKATLLKFYGQEKKIPDFYDLSEDSKNLFIDPLAYTELYLLTIKAGEPKFKYKFVDDRDNVVNIGGYGLFRP